MMSEFEGQDQDFEAAFRATIAARRGAAVNTTEQRLAAERRAGMTPKQRAKRAKKPASVNFRCSAEIRALVDALAKQLNKDLTGVMERAVLALAESEKVTVAR